MTGNPTLEIVRLIGSPFAPARFSPDPPPATVYEIARANRIGLLYLEALDRAYGAGDLGAELVRYRRRAELTQSVIIRVCDALDAADGVCYVVFKSIKPYPTTPNDTDILFLGDDKEFDRGVAALQDAGFLHLEDAPLQRTFYDPSGAGKVHSDKRGGTYYVDLYKKPGADYFVYLDPKNLKSHVRHVDIGLRTVPVLAAGVELAANLVHNVFPEKTYQLQDFYLTLHTLEEFGRKKEGVDSFVAFARNNHLVQAIRADVTLTRCIHRQAFGVVPEALDLVLDELGPETEESSRFESRDYLTPYSFSNRVFVRTFAERLLEWVSLRSLGVHMIHCMNPAFGIRAVERLWARAREGGIYKSK